MALSDFIPFVGERVAGATQHVGRIFLTCKECRRVVPRWRVIRAKVGRGKIGCKCGCLYSQPRNIPEWQAAWWYLIRGRLVRGLILRRDDWEPRIPWRQQG